LLVVSVASCAPATVIQTRVSTHDGKPVAGAEVYMDCPQLVSGDGRSLFGKTNAQGTLDHRESPWDRWIGDDCDLVVRKAGFAEARAPVAEVCREHYATRCTRAAMSVELAPHAVEAR